MRNLVVIPALLLGFSSFGADLATNIDALYAAANKWRNTCFDFVTQEKWTKAWEKRMTDDGLDEETWGPVKFYDEGWEHRKWFSDPTLASNKNLFPLVMLFCRIKEKGFHFPDKVAEYVTDENVKKVVGELERRMKGESNKKG